MLPIMLAESTGNSGVISTLTTNFTSIASDFTTVVTAVTPIVLGVIGMVMVVKFGIGMFRNLSPKR